MFQQRLDHSDVHNLEHKSHEVKLGHPFLKALREIQHGSLQLTTPGGHTISFTSPGEGPDAHMTVHDWKSLDEGLTRGELGFAETYMQGLWDSRDLVSLLTFALMNTPVLEKFFVGRPWHVLWLKLQYFLHRNSINGSRKNIQAHYDLGNAFYKLWLDQSMTYSSALFEGDASRTLEEAQQAKYARILSRLNAQPGDHILDIGCGWGGFAEFAAKKGFQVSGITLSEEQADYARERMARNKLSDKVDIRLIDYREVTRSYDRIVSIGMFEHVGELYWTRYFEHIKTLLAPGGTAMIQSITLDDEIFERLQGYSGFIEHYIFPGGMLPSKSRFLKAVGEAGLKCTEMFGFGEDYARTLTCWLKSFEAHLDDVRKLGYDDTFIRMWRFYLASSIAAFRTHRTDVMQAQISVPHLT